MSLLFCFLWISPALASNEQIQNYQVDIKILQDSTLEVTEIINYDFGDNQKHGIYRDIPILKKSFSETQFEIYDIGVNDDKGNVYQKEISRKGNDLSIKIGSADEYVTGLKIYIINYKVKGAFVFTEESDNLFWNAIGTYWLVPIANNSINVFLPPGLSQKQIKTACYWGADNSTNKCSNTKHQIASDKTLEKIIFKSQALKSSQGVTINLYFDKGIISQPPPPNIIIAFLKKYSIGFMPIFTFLLMFFIWYKKGRDPKGRGAIIAQYEAPKDMMPAELGTIYDERVHSKDISAEIIYLAIHGYLRIRRIQKDGLFSKEDYELEKLKSSSDLARQYQKDLIDNLFSEGVDKVLMSSLKNKAYKWMMKIEAAIYVLVTEQGYFEKNPQKTRRLYIILIAIIVIGVRAFAEAAFSFSSNVAYIFFVFFSVIISIIIVISFGIKMPKKTIKGALAKEYILGLKEYINVAEKDRIKFHNAPAKDPQVFEKLLPYAMAFGLEKEWAKQFEGIYLEEPDWYVSGQGASFSAISFASSLSSFKTAAASTTSVSSSGGSVGGGGGGGGGGSW